MHRRLDDALKGFRIGDPRGEYPIWSDGGSRRASGRWHEAGQRVIYAAEHYSTAMLEKLVHWNGILPPDQHFIAIADDQRPCHSYNLSRAAIRVAGSTPKCSAAASRSGS